MIRTGSINLSECRAFSNHEAWLTTIPEGSTLAETGVANDNFSEALLHLSKPDRLYLVDA